MNCIWWIKKFDGFGNLRSENDIILTARLRGSGALREIESIGCDGVRVCSAVFEVPRLQKPLGCECRRGTAVGVVRSSSDAKERHRRRP